MKKVILSAGALMFGAVGFAQMGNPNYSEITQEGWHNDAIVQQVGTSEQF